MTLTRKRLALILFGLTLVFTALIQETLFQNVDPARRYQVTKAFTSNDKAIWYDDFITDHYLRGSDGGQYYWYGMGETVLVVPADFIAYQSLNLFNVTDQDARTNLRETIVTTLTFPALAGFTIALAFLLLTEFNFSLRISTLGALAFFFGTTFLHYSQIHQENSQVAFLTIGGYYMFLLWYKHRRLMHLLIGSGLFGALLLFRITTFADIAAAGLFVVLLLVWQEKWDFSKEVILKIVRFGLVFGGVVGGFFLLDRLFQLKRFGSLTTNYITTLADQMRSGEFKVVPDAFFPGPSAPMNWPYTLSPITGIVGVLFSPQKSIFIYDPLLIVLIATLIIRHFNLDLSKALNLRRAFLISGVVSLLIYLAGYSTVIFWGGDDAWAARYHTSPVQLLCLLAVPLFLEIAPQLNVAVRRAIQVVIGVAVFFQVCSIIFWYSLEILQEKCGIITTQFRIFQRMINMVEVFSGNYNPPADCWGAQRDNLLFFWPFEGTYTYIPANLLPVITFAWMMLLAISIGVIIQFTRYVRKATPNEQGDLVVDWSNRSRTKLKPGQGILK